MVTVHVPPVEPATELFRRLGYAVSGEGTEFRARRKWRTVHVTVLDAEGASAPYRALANDEPPADASLRCLVTWQGEADAVCDRLAERDPDCEWAVVGVDGEGDYEVHGV